MKINNFMDKSVQELKEMFSNSEFFEEKFDDAVMGVMPKSNRIVYHEFEMIHILMYEIDENKDDLDPDSDEWCDLYDSCLDLIYREYEHCKIFNEVKPKICSDVNLLCKYTFKRPKSDSISSDETLLDAS
jgi:hypothetical protein